MLLKAYLLREYFMWLTVSSHFNDVGARTVTLYRCLIFQLTSSFSSGYLRWLTR